VQYIKFEVKMVRESNIDDGINKIMALSLYIHLPFCQQRCHYCDFNTYTGMQLLMPDYVNALVEEIRYYSTRFANNEVHTIYFGGGTPSLLPLNQFECVLSRINRDFNISDDCEISIEANPGTLNLDYLIGLAKIGINRISIGAQSTNSTDLVRMDRIHSPEDIVNSIYFARKAEITTISLDLIYGLPWQDITSWINSLSRALDLKPDHFSLYSLIIEQGTPLYQWYQQGLIAAQNEDLEADMFEAAIGLLSQQGYDHYEISNWAKQDISGDFRCLHNLQYWKHLPYIGIGAGAHGFIDGLRIANTPTIPDYIKRLNEYELSYEKFSQSPASISCIEIGNFTGMQEFMMLGLRLIQEGVCEAQFKQRFQRSMKQVFEKEIGGLLEDGLVGWNKGYPNCLRLTERGVFLANRVFREFV
jgi:oxygen-independent coproporphyrinogen III oxidase